MLSSEDERDINLALAIVNKLPSNRDILNRLIPDGWTAEHKWYKESVLSWPVAYFRHDRKGDRPLYFIRHPEE